MTTKLMLSVTELRRMTEESYRRTVWDVMPPEERDWVLLQLLRNLALATLDGSSDPRNTKPAPADDLPLPIDRWTEET